MNVPIRIRLAATYCVIFWISAVLLEFGAYAGLKSSIYAVVDNELLMRFEGVVGFLDEHVSRKTLAQLRSEVLAHGALNPDFLQIDTDTGLRLHRGHSMAGIFAQRPTLKPQMFQTTNGAGVPVRILVVRRVIRGRDYHLLLGDNFKLPSEILRRFRLLVFLSSPLIFAFAAMAGYWVSKRALEPVSHLTKTARRIGASNLSERVPVTGSGDEIQDLAETLNGMLGRIESTFRHITQFTANASHELRTPLALIRATAEVALLRTNGSAEHYAEALDRILQEAERNTTLLNNLLQLTRADAAVDVLSLESVEVQLHMEDICERIRPLATEKGVRLLRQDAAPRLWVVVDPEHVRRLWLILFDNAIRHTPSGGTIRVSWHALSAKHVACEISDTGIGISATDLPHICERFFRADKARSRGDSGAGLGLALAKSIVDAHRGRIEVESVLGKGSTFRVVLSRADQLTLPPAESILSDLTTQ